MRRKFVASRSNNPYCYPTPLRQFRHRGILAFARLKYYALRQ